ncbi:MAG: DUF167 domain-containing protein [Verrucomicrobiota bacterium]
MKLHVRATPNARSSEIVGWEEEAQVGRVLRVRIAAPPVDGKANAALREFLAKALGLSKSMISLEKGGSSRYKTFTIPDGTKLWEGGSGGR